MERRANLGVPCFSCSSAAMKCGDLRRANLRRRRYVAFVTCRTISQLRVPAKLQEVSDGDIMGNY